MGVLLTAGKNTIQQVPVLGSSLNDWVNDNSNPNMTYFREHLHQVVITQQSTGEQITIISVGNSTNDEWNWHHNYASYACHCQSYLANYLPLYPGQNEYRWPFDSTSVANLEIPGNFKSLGNEGSIVTVDGLSYAMAMRNSDGDWIWVGSLTELNKDETYRFRVHSNYMTNWNIIPFDETNFIDPYGPCDTNYTYCSTEFSQTGICPDSDTSPGCIMLEYTDMDSNFGFGDSGNGTANLPFPTGAGNEDWVYEIYMDSDTAPIYVNLFGASGEADLTTYVRGTINYTGTTLGGCAGCNSGNYDFGFDDERHCCSYRYGGSRHQYTLEHNNACDKEIWPANNDGYNCHYPTLPPNSDWCGDNICYEGTACSQIVSTETGEIQYFCSDTNIQDTSNYYLFGRFAYNQSTGEFYEVFNSQGNIGESVDNFEAYGSLTNICANAPFLNNDFITGDSEVGIAVIENLDITTTEIQNLDLRVYDCYDTMNTIDGDTLHNRGCLDPTRCNFNQEATIHEEWMCGTEFDCNGNCDRTILGQVNPNYGWTLDYCGLCTDPNEAWTNSGPSAPYAWLDGCGNCIADTKRVIAYNYSGKTISHPSNGISGQASPDGTVWEITQGLDGLNDDYNYTGNKMCEQNSYWTSNEQSECVGVELQLLTGEWVHSNEFPSSGTMPSLQSIGQIYPGWNRSSVTKQCPGELDTGAVQSCIASNNHDNQYTAWDNSCCDYACTTECEDIHHQPVWENKNSNMEPGVILGAPGGEGMPVLQTTGCDIDWEEVAAAGAVQWDGNFDSLYGEPDGIPVRQIRAICGKPQVLPEASTTIQSITYNKTTPTPLFDPVVTSNSAVKSVSILQQGDLDILEDDNPNQLFFGDINPYTGTPGGHDHWKSMIPFLNINETPYKYQITKIIEEASGNYVEANTAGEITLYDYDPDTLEHTAKEYDRSIPGSSMELTPGRKYSIEVVYQDNTPPFYQNSVSSMWDGYQYLTAFGNTAVYNNTGNEFGGNLDLGARGKLFCCADNEPHNGSCDYPLNGEGFCNNFMSGEYALYSRIDSCDDLPGNWIDYYAGVHGDILGCMDPTAVNYNPDATFPDDFSNCNYTVPLGVEQGPGFNQISDYDFSRSGITSDNGVKFKKQITEDNIGYVGTFEIIDYNYGDVGQIYTINEMIESSVIEYEAENKDDPTNDYQAILKYFKLSDPQSQVEPYEQTKFLGGKAYNAMIYPVEIVIQPTPNVFGDFTDSSIGCNAYMTFSINNFRTIVGFELIISNVDDYPVAVQFSPNILKESNVKDNNWGAWVRTPDVVGSFSIEAESLLPPSEMNDDYKLENFVWNHQSYMTSWSGVAQSDVTHARVYPRANALVIPHNTKHLQWSMDNTPTVSNSSTQKYQDIRLIPGEYKVSGWIKYVSGKIKYPDGSYPTGQIFSLYSQTANWPWHTKNYIDLTPDLKFSFEQGHGWKYFEHTFSWLDDNYKCANISTEYNYLDDIWGEYNSWPRYCSAGAGAECTHPDLTNDNRGKLRNTVAWDGNYWRRCTEEKDNYRLGLRSHGSIDPDDLLTVGVYGLQLKRIKDDFSSRNPSAKQFVHKENNKIILPAGVYARDPYDTWNNDPEANFCDPSRVVRLTTQIDTGDLRNSSEMSMHDVDFQSIYDATHDFGIQEWDGLEVGNAGANDFYDGALQNVLRLEGGEFLSILGHSSELTCIEDGIDGENSEFGQSGVPDAPPGEF